MTTVREAFAAAGLIPEGCVPWGSAVQASGPGVYAVATTSDPDQPAGLDVAPLDLEAVRGPLIVRPEASVDGAPATETSLSARLASMWVPGEPIIYIGLAGTSLARHIRQFCVTAIGARAPHAGGWPVKMLDGHGLWVHHATCDDAKAAERAMVDSFATGLPHRVRAGRGQGGRHHATSVPSRECRDRARVAVAR